MNFIIFRGNVLFFKKPFSNAGKNIYSEKHFNIKIKLLILKEAFSYHGILFTLRETFSDLYKLFFIERNLLYSEKVLYTKKLFHIQGNLLYLLKIFQFTEMLLHSEKILVSSGNQYIQRKPWIWISKLSQFCLVYLIFIRKIDVIIKS